MLLRLSSLLTGWSLWGGCLRFLSEFFDLPNLLDFFLLVLFELLDIDAFLVLSLDHCLDLGVDVHLLLRPIGARILHLEDAHVRLIWDNERILIIMLASELKLLIKKILDHLCTHRRVTPELNESLLSFVENEHKNILRVHDTQLDALLDEAFLSLAERDSLRLFVLDLLELK